LNWNTRLAYGTGHILNDLCASMWFTYLLLFFHKVLRFDNLYSGVILTTGQIADGLSTVFVGYFSDQGDDLRLCIRYGKRKSWHLIGTFCVIASFPFIFLGCIGCSHADQSAQLVYFAAFVVIFQFGWAATQISHLSMIPDLTPCQNERTGLTAIRYAATVGSNISVYLLTWAFLGMMNLNGVVGPEDKYSFRNIMICCVTIGAFASAIFHYLVNPQTNDENRMNAAVAAADEESERQGRVVPLRRMTILDWFKEPQFYQVAGIYMSTRLFVNLSQAYIPLYLQITLQLHSSYVATVPLVMFLFGFATSTCMKYINRRVGRKATFIIGCLIGIAGCGWIRFGCETCDHFTKYEIFLVAGLIGVAGSTLLITSLSLTADLIGANIDSGAFVYGAMSLTDKVSNGAAVLIIQALVPSDVDTCGECRLYYRTVLFYMCGGAALAGAIFMLTLTRTRVGERRRDQRNIYEDLDGDAGVGGTTGASVNNDRPDERTALLST